MTKCYSLVVYQPQESVLMVLEAEKSKLKEKVVLVPRKVPIFLH